MNTLGLRMAPSSKVDRPGRSELTGPAPSLPDQGEPLDNKKSFDKVLSDRQKPQDPKELRAEESRPRKAESQDSNRAQDESPRMRKSEKKSERETAMLNFMDSMESEFGVTPVRMLEALAVLDHEDLALNPEESANAVIENLDLTSEEEPRAMALYAHFLQQWRSLPPPENSVEGQSASMDKSLMAAPIAAAGLTTLEAKATQTLKSVAGKESMRDLSRDQLNSTIDQLNARFFMRQGAGEAMAEPAPVAALPEVSPEMAKELSLSPIVLSETPGGENLVESAKVTPAPKDIETLLREIAGLPPLPKPGASVGETKLSHHEGAEVAGMGALATGLGAMFAATGREETSGQGEDLGSDFSDQGGDRIADSTEASSADVDFRGLMSGREFAPKGAFTASAATAAGASLTSNESQSRGNLEAVKDQTQLMIQKGGGEARMILNPEGLGEIHLKVMVKDGKVNVEIGTQNQEAKKLLESSIADLKTSLSSQKLSVEGVKVDLGQTNLSDSQKGMNFGQDMGREQARNMMNQFRNENSNRRDPFFEMSGIKAYARKRPELEPIAPASGTAPRSGVSGRGERMNLVA